MLQKYLWKLEFNASVQTEFPPCAHKYYNKATNTFSFIWVFYYMYTFMKSLDFHSADKAQLHPNAT